MTEKQEQLLKQLKSSMPPDDPHVFSYVDLNQMRWEWVISLLETMLNPNPSTPPDCATKTE
jgi:hypothetical protein